MAKKKSNMGGAREGAGRPKKYADAQRVTLYLPKLAVEALDAQAEALGLKRSEVIVGMLLKTKAVGQAIRDGLV